MLFEILNREVTKRLNKEYFKKLFLRKISGDIVVFKCPIKCDDYGV